MFEIIRNKSIPQVSRIKVGIKIKILYLFEVTCVNFIVEFSFPVVVAKIK